MSLNVPTLTITDLGNGTGASSQVSGSTPGTTNTVYWLGAPQTTFVPPPWVVGGTLTGDGTLATIPLSMGYYWFMCQSTDGTSTVLSNIVYSQVSWNTDSVLYRCLTAMQAQLQTVAFAGLLPSQIQVRYLPRALEQIDTWPLVCIAPIGQEVNPPYLTGLDEVDEPITVAYVIPQNANYNLNLRSSTKVREQINRRLRNQRLPGVPEVMTVEQLPSSIYDASAFGHLWFLALSLWRCKTRQARGA